MKPKILLLAFALLLPGISHAADKGSYSAHYAAVERAIPRATVVKRTLAPFAYTKDGGDLTAYFQHGVPLKMVAHMYGKGKVTQEYYFWQGRLCFVLSTFYHYDESAGNDPSKPDKLIRDEGQDRLYFKDGKLTRWVKTGEKAVESGDEFHQQEDYYLSTARELLANARGKDKVITPQRID